MNEEDNKGEEEAEDAVEVSLVTQKALHEHEQVEVEPAAGKNTQSL